MQVEELVVIDVDFYLSDPNSAPALAECLKLANAIKQYSAFAIRDSRVSGEDNDTFLSLLERYFDQSPEKLKQDTRPEFFYQVGATPGNIESPQCGRNDQCLELVSKMEEKNKPLDFSGLDPKWRFFWRIGKSPDHTKFPKLNVSAVEPADFPEWRSQMDYWGYKMLDAVNVVVTMLAIGLGLPKDTFTKLSRFAPHLLGPTGSDLKKYGKVGTVLAGFHTDLNFVTIHGRSRFPGLNIWTKSGKKMLVKIPDGCLLLQAGKQLEYITGGVIEAGFHEVVVVPETVQALERQFAAGRPLWRISSTLFFHLDSDVLLAPLEPFSSPEISSKYPAEYVGTLVRKELGLIELAK